MIIHATRRRRDRGAASVELVLATPLLGLLLMAAVQLSPFSLAEMFMIRPPSMTSL